MMGFLQFLLWSYLITSGISAPIMGIRTYKMGIEKFGKRMSVIESCKVFILCMLIPYIGFVALVYVSFRWLRKETDNWVKSDPTNPKNIADPNFIPPPKKEKKVKPVEDRFEILDL
jgi:hypothetical protein